MKEKKIIAFTICFILFSVLSAPAFERCIMCGMDLTRYTHVRYQVTDTDGNTYTTCGVQCGLLLQLNLKDKFKSATATDLFSHKTLPADQAWYVYHSSVITDMGPGFIAFASQEQAEKFVKGFGGQLLDWQQALATVQGGFK